jgi:hypothetical protein
MHFLGPDGPMEAGGHNGSWLLYVCYLVDGAVQEWLPLVLLMRH